MIELQWRLFETGHCLHPEASSRAGASWHTCEFPALVALLRHPREGWILFDTGYGEAFAEATRRWPESLYLRITPVRWNRRQSAIAQLAGCGVTPAQVAHVLVSHFHADHVGGLADFPTARMWCARDGWDDLHGRSRLSALAVGLLPALAPKSSCESRVSFYEHAVQTRLPAALAPFSQGYDLFRDGSLYAIPLPGHAAGHFGVCFRAADTWVFLVGDAAWSSHAIRENTPPPRWATALLGDTAAYRQTLAALHLMASHRTDVIIVPTHCREFRP